MAESSLANPLDLAAEWTAYYGDAIANNDDITVLLRDVLAVRSGANGTLHFKLPSTPMTLRCGHINFGASPRNISKFACLENGAAVTIQHTGVTDTDVLWYWNDAPVYEFVVGTTTAKANRNDYLITLVGTWTPTNYGGDGNGYNYRQRLIQVNNSTVVATGPYIFRCHTKKPRGRGGFGWNNSGSQTKTSWPQTTFYIGGTHHNGIQISYGKEDIHYENALISDPYCRPVGWRGATTPASSTYIPGLTKKGVVARATGEFNCQINHTLWTGKITGRIELAYGHPSAEMGFSSETNRPASQFGSSITDPLEWVQTDLGYSGPECAEWGWEPGVLMDDTWFYSQPWKIDGFGADDPAYPSYKREINGNNIYGRSISAWVNIGDGDYAEWCANEYAAEGNGRIVSYITYILTDVAGHMKRYAPGDGTVAGDIGKKEFAHHITYRGDGLTAAQVGGPYTPERNSKLHLSIYDTLETAQVYNAFIDRQGGDTETYTLTGYRRGCYNTIRNTVFNDFGQSGQGKLIVYAGDNTSGGIGATGNTATNIKFIGTYREIIEVQNGGQLDIRNVSAPAGSTIDVQSGANVRLWLNNAWTTLGTGIHTFASSWVSDSAAIPTNIPTDQYTSQVPSSCSLASPIPLTLAYQQANSGASLTNGANITSAINWVRDTYYPNCHILMPNQNWTFYCDPINFSTGNIVTRFALLESPTHQTIIRQTGTSSIMFTFGDIREIVIGSQTKKASRDSYNLTLIGTWSFTNRGDNESGALIWSAVHFSGPALGPFIFRFNAKNARSHVVKWYTSNGSYSVYPDTTVYFSGRWENSEAFSVNRKKFDIDFESLYVSDNCGRVQGWNGDDPPTFSSTYADERSSFCYLQQHNGNVRGEIEAQYGWSFGVGGGFDDFSLRHYTEGSSWEDPLIIKYSDIPYSGPNDFGKPEGVFLNNYGVYFYPQMHKFDGLPKLADNRYRKIVNGSYGTSHTYYSWSTDLLIFHEANKLDGGELGSTDCSPDVSPTSDICGRQVGYLKHTLVNVQGRTNLNGAAYNDRATDPRTAYVKNAIHHFGIRGDGVNPAMVGHATARPGVNTNWELSIWDTAEYAKLHNLDITPYGAPNTVLYVPGSNNSILNCVFTGRVRVLSNPFSSTNNTMTNVKFVNDLYGTGNREVINVAAGTRLDITRITGPTNCYITCNGTVFVNGIQRTGTFYLHPTDYFSLADQATYLPLNPGDIPALPGAPPVTDRFATLNQLQAANTVTSIVDTTIHLAVNKLQDSQTLSGIAVVYDFSFVMRPDGDLATGGWVSAPGGALYDAINETVPSDSDYIWTGTTGDTVDFSLTDFAGFPTDAVHTLRYRGKGAYTVYLLQDSTVLDSWVHNDADFTEHSQILSSGVVAQITNYNTLKLRLISG